MLPDVEPGAAEDVAGLVWVCPISDGTGTSVGPDETVRVTVLPLATWSPTSGLALSTVPWVGWLFGHVVDREPWPGRLQQGFGVAE